MPEDFKEKGQVGRYYSQIIDRDVKILTIRGFAQIGPSSISLRQGEWAQGEASRA